MEKNITTVVCPKCGAEIAISEHEHTVKNATVIGEDSNLGTVVLPLKKEGKPTKAEDRLAALKAAGVNTDGLFAMRGASGDELVARLEDGKLTVVPDDDPIFNAIVSGGTIPERWLFRRWVMSQMFHLLTQESWKSHRPLGFTEALKRKGYEYSWKMAEEELRVQVRLHRKDVENFLDRNRWFNHDVAVSMAKDYIVKLKRYVNRLTERHCKGIPYKHIKGRDIFVSDFNAKIYYPLEWAVRDIVAAKTPENLHTAFCKFNRLRISLPWTTPFSPAWIDAYKGAGAFFTMKNLILFHGCRMASENGGFFSQTESLAELDRKAVEYKGQGWRLFGVMKKLIEDNNIDIKAKMAEWRNNR